MQPASETRKVAEDAFASGLYCAESVVLAIAKARGVESDLPAKMATGFCAGMARSCGPCGALTGGIMGLGLVLGRCEADHPVKSAYVATQRLIREFEQAFGARDCHVLLGCDLGTPEGQATFRNNGLAKQCAQYTGRAAEIAASILGESRA